VPFCACIFPSAHSSTAAPPAEQEWKAERKSRGKKKGASKKRGVAGFMEDMEN